MSEIEKMYENAEVKKQIPKICSNNELYCKGCKAHIENAMPYCKSAEYPPFTAEKQIELCKWLIKNYHRYVFDVIEADSFETDLAKFMNEEWQDLTEEEKQQVKGILE